MEIVEKLGFNAIEINESELKEIIKSVFAENAALVEQYK
jgi:Asp-tRNA(Asn)/Glu-tRNA(Gln) amidotransferase B subunit